MDEMNFRSRGNFSEGLKAGTEPCGLITEEQLVDFAMGQMAPEDQARVQQHRSQCPACDAMICDWSELLGQAAIGTGLVDTASMSASHPQQEAHPKAPSLPQPPRRLRLRLMVSFKLRSLRNKLAANRSRYMYGALGGITVIMLVCSLFALRSHGWPGGEQSRLERDISHQIHLIQSADTEQYTITPHPPYYGEGIVWLKRESGEMLIVVDGLRSVVEKDYQIWLQMDDEASSPGILPVRHPEGKSYYHGYGFGEAERLVISLEPKGGSRVQTGPEAVWVEMRQ
ncbi:anti-sigma factor domain-containing protein [Paenibacillus fonticola]|uniref:anti-sigma factor domain-containing protein n=1 Tax=Paenibacillus fonticola TaxID=379896 RepID=UPI00039E77AB|nr:anti-sigma factor [Paenibacillus fonticola]